MKLKERNVLKSLKQAKILKRQNKCILRSDITKLDEPILYKFETVDMSACQNLYTIPGNFFFRNDNLKTLILPKNKEIVVKEGAFKYSSIENIENSDSICEIADYAFAVCFHLKKFNFSNIRSIGDNAFIQSNLSGKVVIPETCTHFGKNVFRWTDVTDLEVKGNIDILHNTFLLDSNLKRIKFANVCEAQDILLLNEDLHELVFDKIDAFSQNRSIHAPKLSLKFDEDTKLTLNNKNDNISTEFHSLECFATNSNIFFDDAKIDQVILWRNGKKNNFSLEPSDTLSVWNNNVYLHSKNCIYVMSNDFGNCRIKVVGTELLVPHNEIEQQKFFEVYYALTKINKKNNKSYYLPNKDVIMNCEIDKLENCLKNYRQYNLLKDMFQTDIFSLCSTLGLFEFPSEQNSDQNVKYEILRAKVFEGLKKLSCYSGVIYDKIEKMQKKQFNPRRTAFFLENLDSVLAKAPEVVATFFDDVFEKFDTIEQKHKNKSGKLTKMSLADFYKIKLALENKNDDTLAILIPYLASNDVEEQKLTLQTADNLMSEADKLQKKLENQGKDGLTALKDGAKSNYSFEFLKHNDPRQLILGYECDSCARPNVHAVGFGILKSSMTDKDFYTFVVKDKNNNIIGKATMRVVEDKKIYAVINSLEIKKQLRDQKYKTIYDLLNTNAANQIMDTVERAVQTFCDKYKQVNSKEICAVSMGLDTNDLHTYYKKRYAIWNSKLLHMPNIDLYELGHNAQFQALIYSTSNKTIKNKDITNEF